MERSGSGLVEKTCDQGCQDLQGRSNGKNYLLLITTGSWRLGQELNLIPAELIRILFVSEFDLTLVFSGICDIGQEVSGGRVCCIILGYGLKEVLDN